MDNPVVGWKSASAGGRQQSQLTLFAKPGVVTDTAMIDDPATNAEPPPSPEHYAAAVRRVSPLSDTQLAMLNTHFNATDRAITASQMAQALGFTRYSTANAHYGRLGRLIGEQLEYNPMEERLGTLVTFEKRNGEWHWLMRPQLAMALQTLGLVTHSAPNFYPDEIPEGRTYVEGAQTTRTVNAYERDRRARDVCVAHHGCRCAICGFDFAVQYGQFGAGIIHVHHLRQLSTIGHEYQLDPINDLLPVCPNCHAIIHVGRTSLSPETVQANLSFEFRDGHPIEKGKK